MLARMRILLVALTLALAACGDDAGPSTGPLTLSWQFADGRRCTDAGVAAIEVVATETLVTLGCESGRAPRQLEVDGVPRGGTLTLRALSPQRTELYRAELKTDFALSPQAAILFATGAR
jgi:hypothetical protein